jgi:hypothetical protein
MELKKNKKKEKKRQTNQLNERRRFPTAEVGRKLTEPSGGHL